MNMLNIRQNLSTVDVLWDVFPLLMVHLYKYKQDQDTCDHCEIVKFQCIKKYYNFHFFYRQDFLLFETLLSFPYCVNLPFHFLTMPVNFSKPNSTKVTRHSWKSFSHCFGPWMTERWHAWLSCYSCRQTVANLLW